jgi:hypothetical protein
MEKNETSRIGPNPLVAQLHQTVQPVCTVLGVAQRAGRPMATAQVHGQGTHAGTRDVQRTTPVA